MLAVCDRLLDQLIDRADSTGDFDDYLGFGIVDDFLGPVRYADRAKISVARLGFVAHGDPLDAKPRVIAKEFYDPGSDRPKPDYAYGNLCHCSLKSS